jgi:polyribonucleotide nucleotidyltransferase
LRRTSSASSFKKLEAEIVRGGILETGSRIDGRDLATVRPIVRKSAFCRVPTVRRCSPAVKRRPGRATLGTGEDEQFIDAWKAPTRPLHAALQLPALLGG